MDQIQSALRAPDTTGTSASNGTLAALGSRLMTLSPRGPFWHRRFGDDSLFVMRV